MIHRALQASILLLLYICDYAQLNAFQHAYNLGRNRRNVERTTYPLSTKRYVEARHRLRSIYSHSNSSESEPEIVYVDEIENDFDDGELPDDVIEKMNAGQPSELAVMKDLLGINIFTYILAAAIAFFFSMNIILGPGWLGNSIGLEGTGTFEQLSDSLPDTIDLSNDDFLI